MVHPGARDWQAALSETSIPTNAPHANVTPAVHALGLNWWFITATGEDLFGNQGTFHVAKVWAGVGSKRPDESSDTGTSVNLTTQVWTGYSEQSRDEALGLALRAYFSTL